MPRRVATEAGAIYETKWGLTNAKFFMHQLEDLCESVYRPFALEMYATSSIVYLCFAGDEDIVNYLITGVYTWMADCEVHDVDDYTAQLDQNTIAASVDLRFSRPEVYPIQNYSTFAHDSMAPVITPLAQLAEGDRILLQVLVRPLRDSTPFQVSLSVKRFFAKIEYGMRASRLLKKGLDNKSKQLMQEKCLSHLCRINYRVAAFHTLPPKSGSQARTETLRRLTSHIKAVANAVKVYDTLDENKLVLGKIETGAAAIKKIQSRMFDRPFLVSTQELTTLWHPPSLGTLPNTAQVLTRKVPPPMLLPSDPTDPEISFFGHTNYRDQTIPFGIKRFDRRRHLYILGKSGSGKSCLMQLLIRNDIENGFGCAVLDPHGDLVDDILRFIPKHRAKDVVIFDPSDTQFPPSFNPIAPVRPELKTRVTLSFLDVFRRVFSNDWSEQMDHVLRYSILGLVNIPGSSIVSLRRMLSDDNFRFDVVRQTEDESVKRFWLRDFAQNRKYFEEGPISQLLGRLDEVLATDMIRNIVGQPTNRFDFREFMDTRKIVLLKVSKGTLGNLNAELLGSMLIWKIYEAAMSRADVPVEQRQDFSLYIDEFQNYASESFGEILSESRKYKLSLTVANQFLGQLPSPIRRTVFGNIANFLSFRVGADDAAAVCQEFKPRIGDEDLLNLAIRDFFVRMTIEGQVQETFSGRTLDLDYPPVEEQQIGECINHSRTKYCLPREQAMAQLGRLDFAGKKAVGNS